MQMLDRRVELFDHCLERFAPRVGRAVEQRRETAQVAASHEMAAGATDDDHAHAFVGCQLRGARDERFHHREVERVERLRTIERQRRDAVVTLDGDRLGHREYRALR